MTRRKQFLEKQFLAHTAQRGKNGHLSPMDLGLILTLLLTNSLSLSVSSSVKGGYD